MPHTLNIRPPDAARPYPVLHLGGGLGSEKDRLYEFKAGFSRQRHAFATLRLVPDEATYQSLIRLRAKSLAVAPEALAQSLFFPAYRAWVGG